MIMTLHFKILSANVRGEDKQEGVKRIDTSKLIWNVLELKEQLLKRTLESSPCIVEREVFRPKTFIYCTTHTNAS